MIIQYESAEDRLAAELIQKKIGGTLHFGSINPNSLNDDIVLIGGYTQYPWGGANTSYGQFALLGVVPYLVGEEPGYIYVGTYRGYNVYGVCGWERTGTIAAAEWIYLNRLPTSNQLAGNIGELILHEITLSEKLPGGFGEVLTRITQLTSEINNRLPTGYFVDAITLNGNVLEILVRSNTPALAIPFIPIGIMVAIILVGLGIFIGIIKWTSKDIKTAEAQIKSQQELMSECMEKYNCQYAEDIKAMFPDTRTDLQKYIMYAVLIAGMGVGGYFVFKGITKK